MQSRDFCYWLQGLFELGNPQTLTSEQIQIIRNHLNMVFYHEIDPSFGGPEVQDALNTLHSGSVSLSNQTQSSELFHPAQRPPRNGPLMKC
jgi:hypothetical protein